MSTGSDLRLTEMPTVKVGMGIRRPPQEVFNALVDPSITTKFWFTKSSGKLIPGTTLTWEWEMYDAKADVSVQEVIPKERILLEWGGEGAVRTVDFVFTPWRDGGTYVEVTEAGFAGTGDEAAAWLADSTGGFARVLCALKALLEHNVVLNVVVDHSPAHE